MVTNLNLCMVIGNENASDRDREWVYKTLANEATGQLQGLFDVGLAAIPMVSSTNQKWYLCVVRRTGTNWSAVDLMFYDPEFLPGND